MGAVIKYAEYIMGVVFILRLITISPQLVAIENELKGQDIGKFLRDFYDTPHLYKGIQRAFEQPNSPQFTNYLRLVLTISADSQGHLCAQIIKPLT